MTIKTIDIPNRDTNGWLQGTKAVTVDWRCPTCGEEMGETQVSNFYEDGESYAVHTWENECGHIAEYKDLKEIRGPFQLNWLKDGINNAVEFKSIEEIKKVMSKHLYNYEWITDYENKKVDINLKEFCARSTY